MSQVSREARRLLRSLAGDGMLTKSAGGMVTLPVPSLMVLCESAVRIERDAGRMDKLEKTVAAIAADDGRKPPPVALPRFRQLNGHDHNLTVADGGSVPPWHPEARQQ